MLLIVLMFIPFLIYTLTFNECPEKTEDYGVSSKDKACKNCAEYDKLINETYKLCGE
jgi:hypothetical protein